MPSDILAELAWRDLTHQLTDEPAMQKLLAEPRVVYAGFDPTADSLHVGSLMPLLLLRRFQRAGHRPIALVGGATGMIGDPSGKSEERNLLSLDALQANVAGMQSQMQAFLDFGPGANGALLVNNYDWMSRFGVLDFLRDVGKHVPVNVMLSKDSVHNRLDRADGGLSYTEFSYMLLQAYDFVYLHDQFKCQLQVGGSDQWGNITAGIDLGRRVRGRQLYGLTCPLLTKSDGSKMGKTESGAIWLSPARTSPYKFYQYWVNVEDADAGKCLRFLTELARDEIESLDAAPRRRPRQSARANDGWLRSLRDWSTARAGWRLPACASEILFAEIGELSDAQLVEIFTDVPSVQLPRSRLQAGMNIVDALTEAGLAKSKSEARRVVEQGGAYVNNRRVAGVASQLGEADLASETTMVLRAGRRNYALVRFA